jgi:hypothetical protein
MSNVFDSNDADRMGGALTEAWAQLESAGLKNGESEAVAKAALAKAIVDAAEQGERDEAKLVAYALAHYPQCRASIHDREFLRLPKSQESITSNDNDAPMER